MRIVATADLHGHLPETPECDLLLIAGDVCPTIDHTLPFQQQWLLGSFAQWLEAQPAEVIVGVGGNHDFAFETIPGLGASLPWVYLENESVRINEHLIWGSPLSVKFMTWAFGKEDEELLPIYKTIPDDTTILMTHGPMFGMLDYGEDAQVPLGSRSLAIRLPELRQLRLHVCGHIHEARGSEQNNIMLESMSGMDKIVIPGPIHANVSYLDLQYQPYSESFSVWDV